MRLWVDPETSLPVFQEVEMDVGKGVANHFMEMKMDEFIDEIQWDRDMEASFFVPVIPEDYEIFGLPEMKTATKPARQIFSTSCAAVFRMAGRSEWVQPLPTTGRRTVETG